MFNGSSIEAEASHQVDVRFEFLFAVVAEFLMLTVRMPRLLVSVLFAAIGPGFANLALAQPDRPGDAKRPQFDLFARENLIAWCIVPFDAKRRGPEDRAAMLVRLGFRRFAYDYRAEHIPTFAEEITACQRRGISIDAWWFPRTLNDEARHILEVCRQHDIRPQLWVTGGGEPTRSNEEQRERIAAEVDRIRPIANAATNITPPRATLRVTTSAKLSLMLTSS